MSATDTETPALIRYRNHEGHVSDRRIVPRRIYYGSCKWHPTPQWLLDAEDLDKQAKRTFAMRDIIAWLKPMETVGDLLDNACQVRLQYAQLEVCHKQLDHRRIEAIYRVGPVSHDNCDHLVVDHKVSGIYPMSYKKFSGWSNEPLHPAADTVPLPPPWPTGRED